MLTGGDTACIRVCSYKLLFLNALQLRGPHHHVIFNILYDLKLMILLSATGIGMLSYKYEVLIQFIAVYSLPGFKS